jgi:hypothetical protein
MKKYAIFSMWFCVPVIAVISAMWPDGALALTIGFALGVIGTTLVFWGFGCISK